MASRGEDSTISTEIYYFSGTGNSLHVARELQQRIPEASLIPILSLVATESVQSQGDAIGFVFPHYASSLPKIFRSFIEKLDLGSASYLFAIATRGGTKTMAFDEIDKILSAKGRRLDSYFVFTMPSGSEPLVKTYYSMITEERIRRLESEMLAGLDSIRKTIANRETSREEDRGAVPPPPLLAPLMPLIRAATPLLIQLGKRVETRFDFYVDETCTGCGICEYVCLSGRLQMTDGKPAWQETVKCHGCFACLNYCPEESLQVRSSWYLKSYTAENGRYHHREISAGDIAAQKQAERS